MPSHRLPARLPTKGNIITTTINISISIPKFSKQMPVMWQSDAIQRRSNTMMSQSHEHSKAKGIASQAMRCILLTSQEASTCPEPTVIPSLESFWGSCFGFGMVIRPQNHYSLCVCTSCGCHCYAANRTTNC